MYCCIELVFGHNCPNGDVLPDSQIALAEQKVLAVFAQCFGCGQCYHALGSYRTADLRVVMELLTIIRASAHQIDEHWATLQALAREISHLLDQDCVLITVDDSLVWVEPGELERKVLVRPDHNTSGR